MMISAPPDRDATNLYCMAQLQLGRLAIHRQLLRLPTFLCSVKVKGTAYRVVGLRDMLSALETSSLHSSGVVTPATTSTTNLSLFS